MKPLTIHSLLTVIRGFSNEITVRGLANKLGISYSTLARCKNGVWPHSITFDAMRSVLDECRGRFFNGSGDDMAKSMLTLLYGQGIDVQPLRSILESQGSDAFVEELMLRAAQGSMQGQQKGATASVPHEEPTQAPTRFSARDAAYALPLGIVLGIGLLNISLSGALVQAEEHRGAFFVLALCIALSPAGIGALVSVPIAWRARRKRQTAKKLTLRSFVHMAPPISTDPASNDAKAFDFARNYTLHQLACNLLGMMCYIALLMLLLSLPGFMAFFQAREWVEYFKVGIVVAYFIAYAHLSEQPRTAGRPEDLPSPQNHRPAMHLPAWANVMHLVWTMSLLILLLLSLVAYSIATFRQREVPALLLWPYLQAMLFFFCSCASRQATRLHATCVGMFFPGVALTSLGFFLLATTCYLPSLAGTLLCVLCVCCPAGAWLWQRRQAVGPNRSWIEQSVGAAAYSVVVSASIALLLVFGYATSAF